MLPGEQVDGLTPLLHRESLDVQSQGPSFSPIAVHLVEKLNLAFVERPYGYVARIYSSHDFLSPKQPLTQVFTGNHQVPGNICKDS